MSIFFLNPRPQPSALLLEPVREMMREWREEGAEDPDSCSSIAQVDISSHEVSPPNLPPFSHSQKPVGGTGEMGEKKEIKCLPHAPGAVCAVEFKWEGWMWTW